MHLQKHGGNQSCQLGIEHDLKIYQFSPTQVLCDYDDIWCSNIKKSKAKSARSMLPRPSEEDNDSPPKKKQK